MNHRPLSATGYPAGVLLCAVPLLDMAIAVLPVSPGTLQWRFGAIGLVGNSALLPMLGLTLIAWTAATLDHRPILRGVSVLAGLAAVVLLTLVGVFLLDAIQLRAAVLPEVKPSFTRAAGKSGLVLGSSAGVLAWLAYASWVGSPRRGDRKKGEHEDLLVTRKPERPK